MEIQKNLRKPSHLQPSDPLTALGICVSSSSRQPALEHWCLIQAHEANWNHRRGPVTGGSHNARREPVCVLNAYHETTL